MENVGTTISFIIRDFEDQPHVGFLMKKKMLFDFGHVLELIPIQPDLHSSRLNSSFLNRGHFPSSSMRKMNSIAGIGNSVENSDYFEKKYNKSKKRIDSKNFNLNSIDFED